MTRLKKGALDVVDGEVGFQAEITKARSIADAHAEKLPVNLLDDSAELRCAAVLRHSPDLIASGLEKLPAEHRPLVEELLAEAINLGRALEAMDVQHLHGRKIETSGNLRSEPSVTDDQIRNACESHPTREEQAKHLGIDKRQLQRRLQKMRRTLAGG